MSGISILGWFDIDFPAVFTSFGLNRLATHSSHNLLGQQVGHNSCRFRGSISGKFRSSSTLYRETTWPYLEIRLLLTLTRTPTTTLTLTITLTLILLLTLTLIISLILSALSCTSRLYPRKYPLTFSEITSPDIVIL